MSPPPSPGVSGCRWLFPVDSNEKEFIWTPPPLPRFLWEHLLFTEFGCGYATVLTERRSPAHFTWLKPGLDTSLSSVSSCWKQRVDQNVKPGDKWCNLAEGSFRCLGDKCLCGTSQRHSGGVGWTCSLSPHVCRSLHFVCVYEITPTNHPPLKYQSADEHEMSFVHVYVKISNGDSSAAAFGLCRRRCSKYKTPGGEITQSCIAPRALGPRYVARLLTFSSHRR